MVRHYYDFEIDDCPIHEDKDTDQFYRLEIIIPIGLDKPHAGWQAAASWAGKFINKLQNNSIVEKDISEVMKFRLSLGHKGLIDDKTCYKTFKLEN